ncbi:DNA-binding transcriptional LysR family regulator [Rhizobium sp. ERR 922]|uniref:LysR family transcriptional regulator n=1 Tax=unclassified Rhizobium TaxID=2613769 RepID=UPI0011A670CF|nr:MULTISPECIES: LysR family transcriptional regulator [unclassified Rhizobium]TWB57895.1 DNA-binding transcriptional LysR family regulator [Rhizobium sp. ERR 922]TWB99590.1 DNA-binding transcriptional LysR family regulator [Rhizobium sp. ERR 942]
MKASLTELEAIAAVARHGGFRAAARELGMSSSALSHAVAALEERLSVRIFNRTTRSVTLSDAGERFVAEVAPALVAIDRAIENAGLSSGTISGTLRLNMAAGAARILLTPLILEYGRRYPDVEIEIVTDNALVDVIGKGFDAGIRIAEAVPTDMVAIPIIPTLRSLVVGSPAYFSNRPYPLVPGDLLRHRCIRARMASGKLYRWEFERHGQSILVDAPGSLTLDASDLMLSAALEGAGLAYISEASVAGHIAAGNLIAVLEDWSPPYPGLSLYFAQRRQMPARLRALIELIREHNASR